MRILLNGIGRVGKSILRILNEDKTLKIIAINELNTNISNIAYSINYDSTYGNLENKYIVKNRYIQNSSNKIEILNEQYLQNINFKTLGIDIIIDASGTKTNIDTLKTLNVKKIFLTHPNEKANINVILGVNENKLLKSDKIISTSSCNASSLLPVLKIIDDRYGIEFGDIATIHPLLNHQKVLDSSCVQSKNRDIECNFEFGRSSLQNIIPSKTTTIQACSYVLKNINEDLLSSNSFRVPTPTVGAINLSLVLKKNITKENILELFEFIHKNQNFKVILNNYEPLVSSDFIKSNYTSIIDHRFTQVIKNKMLKLVLWYDNEYGYSSKVVDIVKFSCKDLNK